MPARTTLLPLLVGTCILAGCGAASTDSASSASAHRPASTARSSTRRASNRGVNPNARETLPPGDIPDTIAYVPYRSPALGLTISTPEGWSRAVVGGRLTFTDKLNRVEVFTAPGGGTGSASAVRARELPAIRSSVASFRLQSVTAVSRRAGPAARIAYLGDSRPDPVTGKVGTLAFERYDFRHAGREVVVLVSSPQGSDNVDPWRIITNSLRFTR